MLKRAHTHAHNQETLHLWEDITNIVAYTVRNLLATMSPTYVAYI